MLLKNTIFYIFFFQCAFCGFSQQAILDSLEKKLKSSPRDTFRVLVLTELADYYSKQDTERAQKCLQESMVLAKQLSFTKGIAKTFFLLAEIAKNSGKYNIAINYLDHALKLYSELNDSHNISNCYNKTGDVYWWLANYQLALENYYTALRINEKNNNPHEIATCYRNIGWVYYSRQNYTKALEFFEQSYMLFRKTNDSIAAGMLYSDMGSVYGSIMNYNMCLEFFLRSMEILKHSGNRSGIATLHNNLGIAYSNVNEFSLAKKHAYFALHEFEELSHKSNIAEAYKTLGGIYQKTNQYDSALYFTNKALESANRLHSRFSVAETYQLLASIYASMKKYKTAYEYFIRYSELRDSITMEQNLKQISEIQAFYETEKKQQKIELQNFQIKKQNSDIRLQKIFLFFSVAGMIALLAMAFFIWRNYRAKKKTSELLAAQKEILAQKNKDITDSIHYAKKIQEAVFPPKEIKYRLFPDAFVYFRPRDIVSGDFYWFGEKNNHRFIAAADCTGHGVPGAFMSIIGNHLLNEIILEKGILQPAEILNHLHKGVCAALKHDEQKKQPDGMDIALLCFRDLENAPPFIQFSGAQRPLLIVTNDNLREIKPDKFPIGGTHFEVEKNFSNHNIQIEKGSMLYIFSDGYADQFGGETGKKLMTKNFKKNLLSISSKVPSEQEKILDVTFEKWKREKEQVDDVLVIGIRV